MALIPAHSHYLLCKSGFVISQEIIINCWQTRGTARSPRPPSKGADRAQCDELQLCSPSSPCWGAKSCTVLMGSPGFGSQLVTPGDSGVAPCAQGWGHRGGGKQEGDEAPVWLDGSCAKCHRLHCCPQCARNSPREHRGSVA